MQNCIQLQTVGSCIRQGFSDTICRKNDHLYIEYYIYAVMQSCNESQRIKPGVAKSTSPHFDFSFFHFRLVVIGIGAHLL